MEELERSKFTPAGTIANERLIEAVDDPDRYPEGTTFIAADQEGFASILAEAVAEHRPLAIVCTLSGVARSVAANIVRHN